MNLKEVYESASGKEKAGGNDIIISKNRKIILEG